MKTLKIVTAALLLVLSASSFAADEIKSEKLNMDYALKTYIDAVSYGKMKGLADVLDSNVKFTFTRGEKILNYGRSEILKSLQVNEDIEQNCTTAYSIIEQNLTLAIVKVTMKYDGFSKITYLSIANTTKGWKITNISTSFS